MSGMPAGFHATIVTFGHARSGGVPGLRLTITASGVPLPLELEPVRRWP